MSYGELVAWVVEVPRLEVLVPYVTFREEPFGHGLLDEESGLIRLARR